MPPQNKSIVGGTHQKDSIIVSVIDAVRNVPGKHYNVYSCALRERCDDSSLSSLQRYHSHTASNIIVIAHFAAFHSLEVDVHYDFTPERPILFTVEIPESIPVTAGTHLQVISLRAPPAEFA